MAEIQLTQGQLAIVDDADYSWLSQWKWCAAWHKRGFVATRFDNGTVLMHRFILGAQGEEQVDHKNGNTLDNQRSNLRKCTNSQNKANSGKYNRRKKCTSKYKGVNLIRTSHKWRAYIQVEGKWKHLGCFNSEEDAARAYDKAALASFGEFALLNFPCQTD